MKKRILFFDSGVGGMSNMNTVIATYGDRFDYYYLLDNLNFPYSQRDDESLLKIIVDSVNQAQELYKPDYIVIACNTASTLALNKLRELLPQPVVGVVPALKPAVETLVKQDKADYAVGIVATEATVRRPYLHKLIEDFAQPIAGNVALLGTTDLVQYAEAKIRNQAYTGKPLREIFAPWLNQADFKLGAIVLACTHFSLIKDDIAALFPGIPLIDACWAISRRIGVLDGLFAGDIEQERAQFVNYLKTKPAPASQKHLLSTKPLTDAEWEVFANLGFQSRSCIWDS